ncbi:MAG: leucine-rich repeat protein [Candidatus Spyradenecus sp.]
MTTLKRLIFILLLGCSIPLQAEITYTSATDENGIKWKYSYDWESPVIFAYLGSSSQGPAIDSTTSGTLIFPTEIGGRKVSSSLGAFVLAGCSRITNVVFPWSGVSFGSYAFSGCTSLSLTVPATVSSIGTAAFYRVPYVYLEEGFTSVNGGWFYGGSNASFGGSDTVIKRLDIPSTVTSVSSFDATKVIIDELHIKGPYRDFSSLFACCNKIYYDIEYADEWEAHISQWSCGGSRLSVVSTLHGGTTSDRGRYVTWGEEVSVTATAKEGYVFLGWDSDREGIEGTEETITFTMPQAPVTLVANFFPKALLEGWMDTRIDAKVDGERLMTADQAAEKTAAAIEGKVESGELFTPAGAEAKTAEAIAQKVANKELITAESLQEMALDAPVIEVDASGTAKVGISLQKATSLSGEWEEVALGEDAASVSAGALKLAVPAEEGTAFYKFVVPARQGAQEP